MLLCSLLLSMVAAQGLQSEVTILMGEMYFQEQGSDQNEAITLETVTPYKVTFQNVGAMVHRVKFGRGLVVEEGVPFDYNEHLFDGVTVKIKGAGEETTFRVIANQLLELDLDPGEVVEMVFTLPASAAGEWELGCFVVGHYEAGMRAPLIIE
jgi:uncharacterized cupredoxin-like copper-binding protein